MPGQRHVLSAPGEVTGEVTGHVPGKSPTEQVTDQVAGAASSTPNTCVTRAPDTTSFLARSARVFTTSPSIIAAYHSARSLRLTVRATGTFCDCPPLRGFVKHFEIRWNTR